MNCSQKLDNISYQGYNYIAIIPTGGEIMDKNEKNRTGAAAVIWFIISLIVTIATTTCMPRLVGRSASRAHKRSKMRYLDK